MDKVKFIAEMLKIVSEKNLGNMFAGDKKRIICAYIVNRMYVRDKYDDMSFRDICDNLGIDDIYGAKNEFRMNSLSDELCNYIYDEKTNLSIEEKRKLCRLIEKEKDKIDKLVDISPYGPVERYLHQRYMSIIRLLLYMTGIYLLQIYDKNISLVASLAFAVIVLVPGAVVVSLATDMLFEKDDSYFCKPAPLTRVLTYLSDRFSMFNKFFERYKR